MGLIDADEAKRAFIGNRYGTKAIEYVIDNVPTVEAIPVEFIRNEIASSIEVVSDEDYDYNYASCLLQLLERWEKKMKLTNRDKFINDMFNFYIENGWNPRDIHFSLLDVQSNIDSPEFEVKAIPVEQLLSILPEYDDYIHMKTYLYNETMEDIYSKGHEEGWNACLRAIKEELDYWEKENGTRNTDS